MPISLEFSPSVADAVGQRFTAERKDYHTEKSRERIENRFNLGLKELAGGNTKWSESARALHDSDQTIRLLCNTGDEGRETLKQNNKEFPDTGASLFLVIGPAVTFGDFDEEGNPRQNGTIKIVIENSYVSKFGFEESIPFLGGNPAEVLSDNIAKYFGADPDQFFGGEPIEKIGSEPTEVEIVTIDKSFYDILLHELYHASHATHTKKIKSDGSLNIEFYNEWVNDFQKAWYEAKRRDRRVGFILGRNPLFFIAGAIAGAFLCVTCMVVIYPFLINTPKTFYSIASDYFDLKPMTSTEDTVVINDDLAPDLAEDEAAVAPSETEPPPGETEEVAAPSEEGEAAQTEETKPSGEEEAVQPEETLPEVPFIMRGLAYEDENANGVNDLGIDGVVVGMVVKLMKVGQEEPIATTKTDSGGRYEFLIEEPGEYYIQAEQTKEYVFVPPGAAGPVLSHLSPWLDSGVNQDGNSGAFTFRPDDTQPSTDTHIAQVNIGRAKKGEGVEDEEPIFAPFIPNRLVGGLLFLDSNGNGVFDGGEKELSVSGLKMTFTDDFTGVDRVLDVPSGHGGMILISAIPYPDQWWKIVSLTPPEGYKFSLPENSTIFNKNSTEDQLFINLLYKYGTVIDIGLVPDTGLAPETPEEEASAPDSQVEETRKQSFYYYDKSPNQTGYPLDPYTLENASGDPPFDNNANFFVTRGPGSDSITATWVFNDDLEEWLANNFQEGYFFGGGFTLNDPNRPRQKNAEWKPNGFGHLSDNFVLNEESGGLDESSSEFDGVNWNEVDSTHTVILDGNFVVLTTTLPPWAEGSYYLSTNVLCDDVKCWLDVNGYDTKTDKYFSGPLPGPGEIFTATLPSFPFEFYEQQRNVFVMWPDRDAYDKMRDVVDTIPISEYNQAYIAGFEFFMGILDKINEAIDSADLRACETAAKIPAKLDLSSLNFNLVQDLPPDDPALAIMNVSNGGGYVVSGSVRLGGIIYPVYVLLVKEDTDYSVLGSCVNPLKFLGLDESVDVDNLLDEQGTAPDEEPAWTFQETPSEDEILEIRQHLDRLRTAFLDNDTGFAISRINPPVKKVYGENQCAEKLKGQGLLGFVELITEPYTLSGPGVWIFERDGLNLSIPETYSVTKVLDQEVTSHFNYIDDILYWNPDCGDRLD